MVSKELEVDGLSIVFINQSNVRYKIMSLGLMESLFEATIWRKTNDNM
jgi:hypothetical protein